MKTVIALVIALNSLSALAATKFFTKSFSANTEAELVALVEAAIPAIKNGTDRSMDWNYMQENCWQNNARNIQIQSLSVQKLYKVEADTLNPYFTGSLSFLHKNCRLDR